MAQRARTSPFRLFVRHADSQERRSQGMVLTTPAPERKQPESAKLHRDRVGWHGRLGGRSRSMAAARHPGRAAVDDGRGSPARGSGAATGVPAGRPPASGLSAGVPGGLPAPSGLPVGVPAGLPAPSGAPEDAPASGLPLGAPAGLPAPSGLPVGVPGGLPVGGPAGLPAPSGLPVGVPGGLPAPSGLPAGVPRLLVAPCGSTRWPAPGSPGVVSTGLSAPPGPAVVV
jgi:hypothetical protein